MLGRVLATILGKLWPITWIIINADAILVANALAGHGPYCGGAITRDTSHCGNFISADKRANIILDASSWLSSDVV